MMAAAVAIEVSGSQAVFLEAFLVAEREAVVAAGGHVIPEHVAIGHLADDAVHALIGKDGLDGCGVLLETLVREFLELGCVFTFPEVACAALGLHGDDGEVGLGGRVEGAADGIGAHGSVVVLDHDLVDPAAFGGGGDDFGKAGVVAREAAELDLAEFLQFFERRLDVRIAEERKLATGRRRGGNSSRRSRS